MDTKGDVDRIDRELWKDGCGWSSPVHAHDDRRSAVDAATAAPTTAPGPARSRRCARRE
jgi:hypothetical protein